MSAACVGLKLLLVRIGCLHKQPRTTSDLFIDSRNLTWYFLKT
jgi:hypothetical protein